MSDKPELTILNEIVNPDEPTGTKEPTPVSVDALVGEGKKYKTVDDLAKAKTHADEHINTILEEKRAVEAQLAELKSGQKTVNEIMEAINEAAAKPKPVEAKTEEVKPNEPVDVAAMVEAALAAKDAVKLAEARDAAIKAKREEIQTKLIEAFDSRDNAKACIDEYAKGDPAKLAAIDALVLADFDKAVEMLKDAQPEGISFSDGPSKLQTSTEVPSGLTWSKCQQIKKTDPKLYGSVKFTKAMHAAMNTNENFLTS